MPIPARSCSRWDAPVVRDGFSESRCGRTRCARCSQSTHSTKPDRPKPVRRPVEERNPRPYVENQPLDSRLTSPLGWLSQGRPGFGRGVSCGSAALAESGVEAPRAGPGEDEIEEDEAIEDRRVAAII